MASDYKLNTVLLSLIEMPESHTGVNIAKRIFEVTERYRISDRIGAGISDNASNMDAAFDKMERQL